MRKGEKVPHNSSTHSNNMIKKFGKSADSQIIKLIHKLEKREACIESQGELLLAEREKNLGLEACLSKKREEVEKLNIELSLAKD
jgi:3-deoxy-D-manno-octulosonate 8-phosphate phosphatase KdsC-like HAD superfamily phosphatase